jgi:hypothetical protein
MKTSKFLCFILPLFALISCGDAQQQKITHDSLKELPEETKVIKLLGNGWLLIEIEGKKFIYKYNSKLGGNSTEILTPFGNNETRDFKSEN